MTEAKKTWDDIPSLENLEVDWNFKPESPLGKRSYVRVTARDLYRLFQEKDFTVAIKIGNRGIEGNLLDISEGGISIKTDVPLDVDSDVTISLTLGNTSIISNGTVKMIREIDGKFVIGVQFDGLPKKVQSAIRQLYPSAKILR